MTAGYRNRILCAKSSFENCARLVRAFVRQGSDVMARLSTKRVDPFYLSPAWRKLRAAYLAAHPTCEAPYCGRPASHVDHVQSRAKRPDLALVWDNLQALCVSHHSSATARYDRGFGNSARGDKLRAAHQGCDASGLPRDPRHHWR